MALTKCPECGHDVSDKAAACPYCGAPVVTMSPPAPASQTAAPVSSTQATAPQASTRASGCMILAAVVIGIVILMAIFSEDEPSSSSPPAAPAATHGWEPPPVTPSTSPVAPTATAGAVEATLAYLNTDVPEIAWSEIDGNSVYLGFSEKTEDLVAVTRAAAFHAAKVYGADFYAWAVDAKKAERGWRPGQSGLICKATGHAFNYPDDDCPP